MPTEGLITRLTHVFTSARSYSRNNLGIWLDHHEQRQGGILVVRASWRGRDLIEADFRSENWPL